MSKYKSILTQINVANNFSYYYTFYENGTYITNHYEKNDFSFYEFKDNRLFFKHDEEHEWRPFPNGYSFFADYLRKIEDEEVEYALLKDNYESSK